MMSQQPPIPTEPPPTAALRVAAVVVLLLALAATGLQLAGIVNRPESTPPEPTHFAPPAITLMAGLALAATVEGIARLVGRTNSASPPTGSEPAASSPAVIQLAATVMELRSALPDMLAELRPPPVRVYSTPPFADTALVPGDSLVDHPIAEPPAPTTTDLPGAQLDRIVKLLEELKELALLDEGQRQARGQMSKERKKLDRLDEAVTLIRSHEWERADALLTLLESLHPGDGEVLARRNELDDLRAAAREADWQGLVRQVEDLLALGRFDDAAAVVAVYRESHPAHTDAAGLAAQITSDRDAHVERTSSALFHEIKLAVDNRQWRMALDGTQQFLGKFPDHPRSDRIRQQVRTIQKNAEIEERHEQEDRIKELARAGRFGEAADLCETLLARFPDSPQAPTLRGLLPKLRERSAMAEAAVE